MDSERDDFCYSPFNLAVMINNRKMRIDEADAFLNWVSYNDSAFVQSSYRGDARKLQAAAMQYLSYLNNKKGIKSERAAITKDYDDAGIASSVNHFFFAEVDPHHYLKSLRLRALYFNANHKASTTLRQILKHYGYRKRSHGIIEEIEGYLDALHLAPVESQQEIDLFEVKLDDRLTLEARK